MIQKIDMNKLKMNSFPLVSIVIPNYNGLQYLEKCLNSVQNQSYTNTETIFVDNGSVDESCDYVTKNFPWVSIVKNLNNLGFSGGANAGIWVSKGEYIFTLNTDTELDPDCLLHLVHELELFPTVGLCGPKVLFFDGKINSTGLNKILTKCKAISRDLVLFTKMFDGFNPSSRKLLSPN